MAVYQMKKNSFARKFFMFSYGVKPQEGFKVPTNQCPIVWQNVLAFVTFFFAWPAFLVQFIFGSKMSELPDLGTKAGLSFLFYLLVTGSYFAGVPISEIWWENLHPVLVVLLGLVAVFIVGATITAVIVGGLTLGDHIQSVNRRKRYYEEFEEAEAKVPINSLIKIKLRDWYDKNCSEIEWVD